MTLNEPQVYIDHGHRNAVHAPGLTLTTREQFLPVTTPCWPTEKPSRSCGHRAASQDALALPSWSSHIPATDSPEDYAAAEKVQKSVEFGNHFNNAWWFEPACLGHYPEPA